MSEIDIAEDEAHYQELDTAAQRGDQKCDYTITIRSHGNRIFSRPVKLWDKGWVLVAKDATDEDIRQKVLAAIKNAESLLGSYSIVDFSYSLSPYSRHSSTNR